MKSSHHDDRHPTAERLQTYLDGGLPTRELSRLEEHVAACADCADRLDSWRVLFEDLAALPSHRPHAGFEARVMAGILVPEPLPLAARVRRRLASLVSGARPQHVDAEVLQDLVEGLLPARRAARIEAHLSGCAACRTDEAAWRSVFDRLGALGRFAPGEGFAARVMRGVRMPAAASAQVRRPTWQRALVAAGRVVPRTRRAWAALSGAAVTPAAVFGLLFYTVFSHPTLTPQALSSYALWQVGDLLGAAWSAALTTVLGGAELLGVGALVDTLLAAPMMVAGGVLAYSLVFALAVRILYQNLVRTRSLNGRYARASAS